MSQVIFLVCSLSAVTRSTSKTLPPQLLQLLGTDATIKVSTSLMCAFSHSVMSESLWPMDCSPPGPSFCGISQARILEWVATSFSRGSSQHKDQTRISCVAGRFFIVEPLGKPNWCYAGVSMVVTYVDGKTALFADSRWHSILSQGRLILHVA